jgi:D-glycero-D-manno-heptose 1,7-bisphosphate phosphatase
LTARALFLDRDGVINVDYGYVYQPERFVFIDGVFRLCRAAIDLGFCIVVVSNQAGIGRGFYTESQYHSLTDWMRQQFSNEGVVITATYYCPYHPVHGVGSYKRDSQDRKPKPGMILRSAKDLALDLPRSVLIGNQITDIQAAAAAGVGFKMLFKQEGGIAESSVGMRPDAVVQQLDCATPLIEKFARMIA